MASFRGTYTVMITAFDKDGALDLDAQARFTEWQIAEGIHGLIPLGSTGEFLSLSVEERRRVAKCVVEVAKGRVPVLIGARVHREPPGPERWRNRNRTFEGIAAAMADEWGGA